MIFQRGGGGYTVSNIIVMAFSPRNIVGCLLKKGLQRGVTGTPGSPLATPLIGHMIGSYAMSKVSCVGQDKETSLLLLLFVSVQYSCMFYCIV